MRRGVKGKGTREVGKGTREVGEGRGGSSAAETSSQRVSTDTLGGQPLFFYPRQTFHRLKSQATSFGRGGRQTPTCRSRGNSSEIKELFVTLPELNESRDVTQSGDFFSLLILRPMSQTESQTLDWLTRAEHSDSSPTTHHCCLLLNAGNMGAMLLVSRESAWRPLPPLPPARSAGEREETKNWSENWMFISCFSSR